MRERRPLGILPTQAHRSSVHQQRSESECLGVSPVYSAGISHRLGATRQRLGKTWIDLEVRRPLKQMIVQIPQPIGIHCRVAAARARLVRLRFFGGIVFWRMYFPCFHGGQNSIELCRRISVDFLHLVRADDPFCNQTVAPHFAGRRMRANFLVERRLRKGRLVGLVVSMTTVAD